MRITKLISLILALCLLVPCTAFAKDMSGVEVNEHGKLVKGGSALSGFYNQVYYQNGTRDSKLNGIMKIDGTEYYLRQGKPFTGIYGNRYYQDGKWFAFLNGSVNLDGKEYEFVKGEVDDTDSVSENPSFTDKYNLFTGPMSGFYYENGHIDFHFTGFKTYMKHTYYVRYGKLFNGYFDGCYYKNGLADADFCGIHTVGGKDYCFMAGYFFTGVFDGAYYVNGKKSSFSGYKIIDNVRYFLTEGLLANGVFDGAFFKNGLVDVSVNGKIKVDDELYNFVNGITADGLHDGRWYTDGEFDASAQGVKVYNGLPHFFKDGVLSSGVADYKGRLRYFKKGELSSFEGWLEIDGNSYYTENSQIARGVKEIDGVSYLFDGEGKLCKEREAIFENTVYTSDENGIASLAPQIYISQRDCSIPYPHKARPNGTISSSGCGVCSALMILLNETTYESTLEEMTQKMLDYGCRDAAGTDMKKTAEMLEKDYGITFEITDDNAKLKEHLEKGYLAVANVGKIPLFSLTGGHFVVISGLLDEDNVIIFDPSVREGKFGSGERKDIKYVSENNNEVYASFDTLRSDSWYGCYYLFTPTKDIALRRSERAVINKD